MRCDVLVGLLSRQRVNLSVPLGGLAGTNYKEGKEILEKSKLKILSDDLNDAANKL